MTPPANWRAAIPDKLRFVFLLAAGVLALAAALAPLVFLLRRIGVG
jgi:hypothetical protein